MATRHLATLFGEPSGPPSFQQVIRHHTGIPGYRPGHRVRVATVREAVGALPGLHLIGNHLEGIGVKDCAKVGEGVAGRVMAAV